jgi:hypothetical protein
MPNSTKQSVPKPKRVSIKWLPLLRRVFGNWRAWALVAAVVAVIGSWRGVVALQRMGLGRIANEIGSVAEFWGEPVPNQAGTRLLFQQSTEKGVGTFFAVIPGGRRVLLREKLEKGFDTRDFMSAGWSPDGQQFAFGYRVVNPSGSEVLICDGNTGTNLATVKVPGSLGRLVWLSSEAIVYVDEEQTLHKLETIGGNRWRAPKPFLPSAEPKKGVKRKRLSKEERSALLPVRRLTAATANSVLFLRGQALWSWEFGEPEPVKVWESTTNELVNLSRDLNGRQFLLQCRGATGTTFFRFDWPSKDFAPIPVKSMAKPAGDQTVWFNGGGNAWLQGPALYVRSNPAASPTRVAFAGGVNSVVGNDRELYLVGSRAGEPVAIWRYDIPKAELSCVVSNSQPTFKFAKAVCPSLETMTNRDGRVIAYRVWSPPNLSPRKKYPLLVGRIDDHRWFDYPGLVANGGAYFLSVDQDFNKGDWSEAMLAVYEHVKSHRKIDEDSLFLYGYSGGSQFVDSPLEKQPEMWRGAILFSPVAVPDLRRIGGIKLFLDHGAEDRLTTHLPKYRDEAVRMGIEVTLAVHENAGHHYLSIASLRERDEALMKFLFGR